MSVNNKWRCLSDSTETPIHTTKKENERVVVRVTYMS